MKDKNFELSVAGACFMLMLIIMAIVIACGIVTRLDRPKVVITREYYQEVIGKGQALIVDYSIGGVPQFQYFYEDEIEFYQRFVADLERIGKVERWTK